MFSRGSQNQTTNTVYVFIDASNLWEAQKAKGRFFDYEKLRNFIKKRIQLFGCKNLLLYRISSGRHSRLQFRRQT